MSHFGARHKRRARSLQRGLLNAAEQCKNAPSTQSDVLSTIIEDVPHLRKLVDSLSTKVLCRVPISVQFNLATRTRPDAVVQGQFLVLHATLRTSLRGRVKTIHLH